MSRDLDEQCARAMGLTIRDAEWVQTHKLWEATADTHWTDDAAALLGGGARIPAFSTDPAHARLLEDEIERRDRWDAYIYELFTINAIGVADDNAASWSALSCGRKAWLALRATPEQRARAFIAATQSQ